MKKLSVFLLALVAVLGLAACDPSTKPTDNKTNPGTTPAVDTSVVLADEAHSYHVVGGAQNEWAATDNTNNMEAISLDDLAEIAPAVAESLEGKNVRYLYAVKNYGLAPIAGGTTNANVNGEVVALDGGYTLKVIRGTFDEADGVYSEEWLPDPHKAHAETLTPETLFMPKWRESDPNGDGLGLWNENPVCVSGAGYYTVIFADYGKVSTAEEAAYGIALVKTQDIDMDKKLAHEDENISYHAVGNYVGDWATTETNTMEAVSLAELAEIDARLARAVLLNPKSVAYVKHDYVLNCKAGMNGTCTAGFDSTGAARVVNEAYAFKVIRGKYDAGDDVMSNDMWISDPNKAHAQNLTPDTLFIPKWREADTENDGLGVWNQNPVCVGGAGKYTVVVLDYRTANSATKPGFALGLIQTEKLEEYTPVHKQIENEYAGLKDGSVTTASTWEFSGTVKTVETVKDETAGTYTINMVLNVASIDVAVTGALVADEDGNAVAATDIAGLGVGKTVSVKGSIDKDAAAVGETSIVFAGAVVSWPKVYQIAVTGIPANAVEVNVYTSGNWPGEKITKDATGAYVCEIPVSSTLLIFNWKTDANAQNYTQTVDLTPSLDITYWEIGAAGTDGKYAAAEATLSEYYVKGDMNGWGAVEYHNLVMVDGAATLIITMKDGQNFKVADANWSKEFNYSHVADSGLFEGEGTGNITVKEDGTYKFTVTGLGEGETPTLSVEKLA